MWDVIVLFPDHCISFYLNWSMQRLLLIEVRVLRQLVLLLNYYKFSRMKDFATT